MISLLIFNRLKWICSNESVFDLYKQKNQSSNFPKKNLFVYLLSVYKAQKFFPVKRSNLGKSKNGF